MKVNAPVYIQGEDLIEPPLVTECPACFALVLEARLADHQKAAH